MNEINKYFESSDQFFGILADMSGLYVSANKQRYILISRLRATGVIFKDVRSFLMNRAIECGLFEKGKRESEVINRAWYVTLNNFTQWLYKTYEDYDVLKDVKKLKTAKDNKNLLRKTIVTRKKDASGNVVSQKEVTTEQTVREKVEELKAQAAQLIMDESAKRREEVSKEESLMNKPIIEQLSPIQIAQIVFQNLFLLAERAEAAGAQTEWNALMSKMGLFDEMVDGGDDPELSEIPVTDAPAVQVM